MAEATLDTKESRIGKQPIKVPKEVQVSIDGTKLTVKGPKGEIARELSDLVQVTQEEGAIVVGIRPGAGADGRRWQGTSRSLIRNAVQGVSEGFKVSLDLVGVGYRAEQKGQELTLSLGLSHPVHYTLPDDVSAKVETVDRAGTKMPRLHLESRDKELLGATAARIRSFRPPEPYKGKGVRYTGERIREKAGKAGGK